MKLEDKAVLHLLSSRLAQSPCLVKKATATLVLFSSKGAFALILFDLSASCVKQMSIFSLLCWPSDPR